MILRIILLRKFRNMFLIEIKEEFGDGIDISKKFSVVLTSVYNKTNIPFVIIIDEWDCIIRNSDDEKLVHQYLQFLHSLFKSEEAKSFFSVGVYYRNTAN